MKKIKLLSLFFIVFLASCNDYSPLPPYVYEANPHYAFGYAEFYGSYYAEYGNLNNTLSVSLFSDSLKITENGELAGYGQFLYLEDVFVAPTDTFLAPGTYSIEDSGKPFTAFKGTNDTINGDIYHSGAYINYYEKTASKSIVKLINAGTFTVSLTNDVYNISFDFITADKKPLKGTFKAILPHFNQATEANKSKIRKAPLTMRYW